MKVLLGIIILINLLFIWCCCRVASKADNYAYKKD